MKVSHLQTLGNTCEFIINNAIFVPVYLRACLDMIIKKFLKHTVFLISYLQSVISFKWPHLPLC
jgi:hypothetical protein